MRSTDKALRLAEDVVFAWNNKNSKTPTGDASAVVQRALNEHQTLPVQRPKDVQAAIDDDTILGLPSEVIAYIVQLEAALSTVPPEQSDEAVAREIAEDIASDDTGACSTVQVKILASIILPRLARHIQARTGKLVEALERIASKNCGSTSPDLVDHIDQAQETARTALAKRKGE